MIAKLSKRHLYYLFGFAPAVLAYIVLKLNGVALVNISYLLMCYIWPMALYTPGFEQRVLSTRYRYSFLGMAYKTFIRIVENIPVPQIERIARNILPFSLCLLLYFISEQTNFLYAILGTVIFEIYFWLVLNKKFNLSFEQETTEDISSERETQGEFQNEESDSEAHPDSQNPQRDND